jgi:hypothetical protein
MTELQEADLFWQESGQCTDPAVLQIAIDFVRSKGIEVVETNTIAEPFFDGVGAESGVVLVNPLIANVGDFLHEAGHIATMPESLRPMANGDFCNEGIHLKCFQYAEENGLAACPGDDDAATYWAFCACRAAGLDDRIPFLRGYQEEGYELWQTCCLGVGFNMGSRFSVPFYYLRMIEKKGSDQPLKWKL